MFFPELKGAPKLKSRFAPVPGAVSVLLPGEMLRCDKHSSNNLELEFERAFQKERKCILMGGKGESDS